MNPGYGIAIITIPLSSLADHSVILLNVPLIFYSRLFSTGTFDFVQLGKCYCEFDYVQLLNPIKLISMFNKLTSECCLKK